MSKKTKNNVKKAFGVWGRVVSATVLCMFLYFTSQMVVSIACPLVQGYRITQLDESNAIIIVDEHYYQEGEDTNLKVNLEESQAKVMISSVAGYVFNAVMLVIMLTMVGAFPYNTMWKLGSSDVNKVNFGRKKKDILRGLKIGALATIPSALLYVGLLLSKCGVFPSAYIVLYRLLNQPYLPFINWLTGLTMWSEGISWLAMLGLAVTLLFIPAVCAVGYVLGYRNFSVHDKLVYRKRAEQETDEEI